MFPLTAVLLPGALLPLHVFEPRYLTMIPQVITDNGEFGVVMIKRGSEVGGNDVRAAIGTMAKVLETRTAGPKRLMVLTVGDRRIRVRRWLSDKPFPRAETEDWPDEPNPNQMSVVDLQSDLPALVSMSRGIAARLSGVPEPEILVEPTRLGDDPSLVAYRAAALAPLGPLDRYEVLGTPSAAERVSVVHRLITEATELLQARLDFKLR